MSPCSRDAARHRDDFPGDKHKHDAPAGRPVPLHEHTPSITLGGHDKKKKRRNYILKKLNV